jgi:hypothetical protein
MRQLRQEAYGKDIGQHSWVTADEFRSEIGRLSLTTSSRLLDVGCGPCRALGRAGLKESCGAEVGPINAALLQIPKHLDVSVDYGDPFRRKVPGRAQRDARCDEEAARSAHYDEPGSTGLLDSFDEAIHNADVLASVIRRRPIG